MSQVIRDRIARRRAEDFDITANCILPGTIDTPQNRAAMPKAEFQLGRKPAALADVIFFYFRCGARGDWRRFCRSTARVSPATKCQR
jgi:NAD(P)-dependent dehydrogenase (short-subunit alcohol dehydrogenase family)